MSVDYRTETLPASGRLELPPNNFFFLVSASSAIILRLISQDTGNQETFQGLTAALSVTRVRGWRQGVITGAAGATIVFFYGSQIAREDNTDYRQTIATIGGTVTTKSTAGAMTTASSGAIANAASLAVAANAARVRIWVCNPSSNTWSVFIQTTGTAAASRGIEVAPGVSVPVENVGAFDVRNDGGGAITFSTVEET